MSSSIGSRQLRNGLTQCWSESLQCNLWPPEAHGSSDHLPLPTFYIFIEHPHPHDCIDGLSPSQMSHCSEPHGNKLVNRCVPENNDCGLKRTRFLCLKIGKERESHPAWPPLWTDDATLEQCDTTSSFFQSSHHNYGNQMMPSNCFGLSTEM